MSAVAPRRSQRGRAGGAEAAAAAAAAEQPGTAAAAAVAAAVAAAATGAAATGAAKARAAKKKQKEEEEKERQKEERRMKKLELVAERERELEEMKREIEQELKEEEDRARETEEEQKEGARRKATEEADIDMDRETAAERRMMREMMAMRKELDQEEKERKKSSNLSVIPLHKVAPVPFKGNVLGKEYDEWMRFIRFQFLRYKGDLSSDEAKISWASGMFTEQAMLWWVESGAMERVKTWTQFVEAMELRFRPANLTTEALFSFQEIKQGERQTVAEYITTFTSATAMLKPNQVTDLGKIVQFIKGLKAALHGKVMEDYRLEKFSMEEVQQLAIHKELTLMRSSSSYHPSSYSSSSSSSLHALSLTVDQEREEEDSIEVDGMTIPKAELLNFMQQRNAYGGGAGGGGGYQGGNRPNQGRGQGGYGRGGSGRPPYPSSQNRGRLSREEQDRRRRDGLCYTCGGAGHVSRGCQEQSRGAQGRYPPSSSSSSSSTQSKK